MEKTDANALLSCALNEEEFHERRISGRRELIPLLEDITQRKDSLVLRFQASKLARQKVEHFVELERQCCGFLTFEIGHGADLALTISGPPEAVATLHMIRTSLTADQPGI